MVFFFTIVACGCKPVPCKALQAQPSALNGTIKFDQLSKGDAAKTQVWQNPHTCHICIHLYTHVVCWIDYLNDCISTAAGFTTISGASLHSAGRGRQKRAYHHIASYHLALFNFEGEKVVEGGCHTEMSLGLKVAGLEKAISEDDVIHAPTLPTFGQADAPGCQEQTETGGRYKPPWENWKRYFLEVSDWIRAQCVKWNEIICF